MKRLNKNKTKLIRSTSALLASLSLSVVQMSAIADMQGMAKEAVNSMSGNSGSELTNAATGLFQGVVQMSSQMGASQQQTSPELMQAWNTLLQDSRKNIGNDNMGAIRHYMFPNCLVPPDKTAKPSNLCSPEAPDYMVTDFMKIGQDYVNMYKKYTTSQNSATPVGMQCMENSIKSLDDAAKTSLGELEKMVNAFDAMKKKFETDQQINIKNMKDLNQELNGGGAGGNSTQDFKNKDYTAQFPKECNDLLDGKLDSKIKDGGLVSLQKNFIEQDYEAANFRGASLTQVKQQIANDKKKFAKILKEQGINGALGSVEVNNLVFGASFQAASSKILNPIKAKINKANAIIAELGISDTLPSIDDSGFQIKLDTILEKSQTTYKDKFILDCMRGDNNTAYSTSINNVIGQFENRKTGGQGATLSNFKSTAPGLIGSAQSLVDLENSIQTINDTDIKIQVNNSDNIAQSKTLSQYYFDLKSECTNIYDGRLAPANGDLAATNYKKRASQAKAELASIQKDIQKVLAGTTSSSFGAIEQEVDNLINNCDQKEVDSKSCSAAAFTKTNPSFCLKRATTCSTRINSCKTTVANYVTDRTNKLKANADLHNKAMTELETKANALVNNMNTLAENMSKSLYAKLYPAGIPAALRSAYGIPTNSGFAIPEGVKPINLVAQDNAPFNGILLKGISGGKLDLKSFDSQFKKNVTELKRALGENIDNQLTAATDMISKNTGVWENEMNAWKDLLTKCAGVIDGKKSAIAKANEDAQKAASENAASQSSFCRKMVAFSAGPGCKGTYSVSELYEEANEIGHLLGADVFGALGEYDKLCGTNQSEDSEDEKVSNREMRENTFLDICEDSAARSTSDFLKYIKENYIEGKETGEFTEYSEDIEKYLSGKETSKEFRELMKAGTPFGARLKSYKNIQQQVDGKDSICQSYNDDYKKALEECRNKDTEANKRECKKTAEEDYAKSNTAIALGTKLMTLTKSDSENKFTKIGESYGGTSCASIAGTSKPKGMFQNNNIDFADIFSQGVFNR